MTVTPSPQQVTIMETLRATRSHLSIRALAGTGKTTTIRLCQPIRRGLNLAFNRNVRAEFQDTMPEAMNHTFNSFGHMLIKQNIGTPRFDAKKLWHIFDELRLRGSLGDLRRLIDLARNTGVGPTPYSRVKHTDTSWWERTIEFNELEVLPEHIPLLPQIIFRCWQLAADRIIDYGDQVWCPVIMNLAVPRFEIIYVDEAQDMSPLQEDLIFRMAKRDQVVLVGDPNQAIYGFRGSVSDGMQGIEQRLGIVDPLPLSVTYRCPKAVVSLAQQWVPHYEAADSAPEGSVRELKEWSHKDIPLGATVLCRNNAPLIPLALYLLSKERGATIKGSEIGKSLVKLARSIAKESKPATPEDFISAINAWYHGNYEKPNAEDKANSLIAMVRGLKTANVEVLCQRIAWMFSDEAGLITLSTIHKAKGLEWTSVFLLDKHLIPSKFARSEEELQQEQNLLYVACTRTKSDLTFISTVGLRDV